MISRFLLISLLVILVFSCSANKKAIYEPSPKIDPYSIYKEGLGAFEKNDFFFASKKFTEAELNFEQPDLAAKASIMSSYSLYAINFYDEAEENLKRFLKNYPADNYVIYAHYLLAITQFEQISGEKNDLKPLQEAEKRIIFFLEKYPKTEYAIDLSFKMDLVQNQFAAKEMNIAKYYISVQKWIPAINRLKLIVEKYNETVFIEEALHRLVEIHYHLGLENEAKKFASILGYNYNSSEWFKQSYKILNKNYRIEKNKEKNKEKSLMNKIISIIKINNNE
tara:strand:+ start:5051 stop:5890 length:840 start_codon:yes stop_codon:yes gene_type:complete